MPTYVHACMCARDCVRAFIRVLQYSGAPLLAVINLKTKAHPRGEGGGHGNVRVRHMRSLSHVYLGIYHIFGESMLDCHGFII